MGKKTIIDAIYTQKNNENKHTSNINDILNDSGVDFSAEISTIETIAAKNTAMNQYNVYERRKIFKDFIDRKNNEYCELEEQIDVNDRLPTIDCLFDEGLGDCPISKKMKFGRYLLRFSDLIMEDVIHYRVNCEFRNKKVDNEQKFKKRFFSDLMSLFRARKINSETNFSEIICIFGGERWFFDFLRESYENVKANFNEFMGRMFGLGMYEKEEGEI